MKAKLLLVLALLSAVQSAARAQFTDPLTTTPAFLQVGFGPAGDELANGGQEFCVPVTTAMQLSYLGLNGFNQIAPSTPTAASELNLVQVLSGLAGTDALANGTNYMQMENALQIYLAAAGIGTTNYSLTIKQAPTLNDLAALDTPGTVITLGSGYFDSSGNRSGGHAVSLLGVGFNALGQSSPNTIAVNNQLPNATSTNGDAVANILQYLNVIPTTGVLTADGALELDPSQYPGKWSSSKMFVIEEATVLTINPDELSSNNLIAATWNLATTQVLNLNSGTLPVLAPMAGTGGITLGQFGTLLSEASNTTIGANTIKNSSTWTSTVTSGDPFGRGSITIDAGTLSLSPTAGTASISLTAASGSGNTLTYVNGTEIALNSNGNTSLTLTIGGNTDGATPNLVRQGTGTLVIAVGGGIGSLGQNESLIVAGTGGNLPPLTNGIVSSSIVGQNNDTFSSGDFLTYSVNGFAKATYTQASNTPIDSAASNSVYQANINQTVAANTTADVYALKVGADTVSGGAGSVLEVGPQTSGQAGIILNGGTISTSTLQFGAAEGIVYTSGAGGTISSIIQGSGGLTTFGPGTVTLKGANTYTGPTNINSGILQAQNTSGSATGSGNVFVRSSGALEISGASANVGGASSTTSVNDGGALLLNGGNVSGTLTMSAGSFLFGHGTITAAATISGTIGNSGTPSQVVAYSGVEDITFQNAVSFNSSTLYSWKLNALDAAPADAGMNWSLLNFNSGAAAVGTSGSAFNVTLDLGSTVPDPNSGNAFWNASHQWLIADDPQGFGSIFWNPGFSGFLQGAFTVSLDSASKDLYIDYTPKGIYWKGGTGGSWMGNNWASDSTGTPTVALPTITDDVIFSAAGAANQGATTLGQNWAIHSLTVMDPKPVVINSGAGGPFTLTVAGALGTGVTVFAGSNLTINSNLTLGGESNTIEVDGTGVATINGLLGGSNGLTKTGTGKLTLTNGGNNYTGGTTINGGLVSMNNGGALGTGDVTLNGAALLATATTTLASQVTFSSGTTSTLSAATGTTLTLTEMELDGNAIFGSAGNAGVVVAGPFRGTGQFANSNIEVAFGTLRNGGGGIDLGSFTSTSGTTTTVNAGATLDLHDNSLEVINLQGAGAVTLGTNAATVLTLDSGSFSGVISGAGQLSAAGVTIILTGTNTYTGGTTITAGTLQLGNGGTTGSIPGNVADNGNLTFDRSNAVTFGGVISGTGSLTQVASSVLTLTASNSYSGGTTINAGIVSINNGNALGSGTVTLNNGGSLLSTSNLTLGNEVFFKTAVTSSVSAAAATTLTLDFVVIGNTNSVSAVFGSAGQTGVVNIAPGNSGWNIGSTIDVAFGTLRNGGGLGIITTAITSTTVNAGATLDVHDNPMTVTNLQGAGAVTLGTSAATVLTLDAGSFSGVISGAGQLTKATTGTLTLSGTNTSSGGTTISQGTLQLGNGGTTGSITGNITDNGNLTFDHSNAVTFTGVISGTGSLTESGTGVLTLTGANPYTGGTTINAGEVSIKTSAALGAGNITLNGGVLLTTATMTLASQVGLGTNVTSTIAAASGTTLTLDQVALGINSAANAVFGSTGNTGVIVIGPTTGIGEFPGSTIKVAFGTLRNGGGNGLGFLTESIASTTVNTGATLDVHDNSMEVANLQGAGAVTLGSSAATVLTLDAGSFSGVISGAGRLTTTDPVLLIGTNTYTGGTTITAGSLQIGNGGMTGSITGNVALNADSANLTFDRNNALTFAGTISGSGTLTQAGIGVLTITGTNTYNGGTNINAGAVGISNVSALGTGSITLNGGALHVTATMALPNDIVFGVGATSTVSTAAGTTLTLSSVEVDGNAVFGSTGQTGVVVIGPLTESNALANASIEIAAGTVRNGFAGPTGLGGLTNFVASTTVAAGATLDVHDNRMEVNSLQGAGAVTLGTNAATVLFLDAGSFSGVISGAGQLTKNTTGTLALSGTNTYTGGTTISSGSLQIGSGGMTGSIVGNVTDNGNLAFDHSNPVTFPGAISGTGTLTQSGAGTLTLTGANTYSGGTTINAGAVSIKSPGALGTAGVTLDGGALLAAATMTLASEVTFNPGATSTLAAATGTTLTLSIVEVGLTGGGAAVFGSAGDTGTVVIGPGTAATDDASTIDVAFGTLRNGGNLGFFTNLVASTTVAVGATLDVHDLSMTVINLQGAGAITLGTNAATVLTLHAGSYSGVISGAGQLTKATTGTLALAGASTYSGGTTISAGTLLANNTAGSATGTGPVTIDSGAALGGKGKITGAATLDSGGFIAPGAGSPGVAGTTLHAASLIWNGGGVITLQLGATGDALALTGPLTKGSGGAFTLDITNAGITKTTYTLLTFASTTFTETDFNLSLPVNYTGTLVETSTSLILEDLVDPPPPAGVESPTPDPATEPPTPGLADNGENGTTDPSISTIIPTPEPASTALLALGVAALLGRRRRK